MNKIIIDNGNIINSSNEFYDISFNKITFKKDGSYSVYYKDTKKVDIVFNISSNIVVNLFEISTDNEIVVNNSYIIDNGYLKVNKFYSNKSCNEVINIDLNSSNSGIEYNFSSICLMNEKYVFNINHNCKDTVSNIFNRVVSLCNSDVNFVINSNVLDDMTGSILNQTTKIVTFGECNAKVSPNMFISCDDVVAKHGSVIGTVDEDIIFYMMSRGISYNDSIKLYIKGLLLMNSKYDYDIRSKIFNVIDMYWR